MNQCSFLDGEVENYIILLQYALCLPRKVQLAPLFVSEWTECASASALVVALCAKFSVQETEETKPGFTHRFSEVDDAFQIRIHIWDNDAARVRDFPSSSMTCQTDP